MAIGSNARVAAAPFLSESRVSAPLAIASDTHRRPAASKALRQTGRQNLRSGVQTLLRTTHTSSLL
jgi:hypothetical protein